MKQLLFGFLLTVFTIPVLMAQELLLPAPYTDHMVLQRNRPLTLTGQAPAGKTVQLAFKGETIRTTADATGRFRFSLPAQPAGGPYDLSFTCGTSTVVCRDVYVGEVWLCSGQSNMQFALQDCSTAAEDLALADSLPQLHLYNMCAAFIPFREIWSPERIAAVDRGDYIRQGQWTVCSAEAARHFSAIAFHVGRLLADSLQCHIGLIANALDGCTTEGWIDGETLQREVPEILEGNWTENEHIMAWSRHRAQYNLQRTTVTQHRHPYEPTYLYDAAIRPLAAYPLRGVLWYQGESNAERVAIHERLFESLQHSWRANWQDPALPFHFVQIASLSNRPTWPAFRDSQRRLAEKLPFTYMTVSHDMGEADNIHPTRKRVIGERLAASVLHHTYKYKDIVPSGPTPRRAYRTAGQEVCIEMDHAEGLHTGNGTGAADFEMADKAGRFIPCTALTLKDGEILLRLPRSLTQAVKVRFAYRDRTTAQLLNAAGLPCPTFEINVETGCK